MDICKISIRIVSISTILVLVLFFLGFAMGGVFHEIFLILIISSIFYVIIKKHPACSDGTKVTENYWPYSDDVKMTPVKMGFVDANLRTDIYGNVSLRHLRLNKGNMLKIHPGATLEIKVSLTLETGGIVENNGILNNRFGAINNDNGLIINNGLMINQGYTFMFLRSGLMRNSIQSEDFILKPNKTNWGIKTDNSLGPEKYYSFQNIENSKIANSRIINTKDDEDLLQYLEHKPSIEKGIENNGKIINTSLITTQNISELYNSSSGSIINYNKFEIKDLSAVKNEGSFISFKEITNNHKIVGNTLEFLKEKHTKKQINSQIKEELDYYRSHV